MIPFAAAFALVGWFPVTAILFMLLPPRRATLCSVVFGSLLLPELLGIANSAFPSLVYGKIAAISLSCMACVAIFDANRLLAFRPRWYDLAALVVSVSGLATSVSNHIGDMGGVRDGIVEVINNTVLWGIPYLLGRLYLTDLEAFGDLAVTIVWGGMMYVPLCLFEVRFSPQLHHLVYGYYQIPFEQNVRLEGYRPLVFMQHGLATGMFMAIASLCAMWLWWTKAVKRVWGMPIIYAAGAIFLTFVLCRASGAYALFALGAATLWACASLRSAVPLLILAAIPPTYIVTRASGLFTGDTLVRVATAVINKDRADSLAFRLLNENALADRALERPFFGWGGWGRFALINDQGGLSHVPDGLWVLTLGKRGIVGLAALVLMIELGATLLPWRLRVVDWSAPGGAAAAVLAICVLIHMADCLPNAMPVPAYLMAAGGLAGLRRNAATSAARTGAEAATPSRGRWAHLAVRPVPPPR